MQNRTMIGPEVKREEKVVSWALVKGTVPSGVILSKICASTDYLKKEVILIFKNK